jgi:hypothetical protein
MVPDLTAGEAESSKRGRLARLRTIVWSFCTEMAGQIHSRGGFRHGAAWMAGITFLVIHNFDGPTFLGVFMLIVFVLTVPFLRKHDLIRIIAALSLFHLTMEGVYHERYSPICFRASTTLNGNKFHLEQCYGMYSPKLNFSADNSEANRPLDKISMLAKAFQLSKKHLGIDKVDAQTFISMITDRILKRAKGDADTILSNFAKGLFMPDEGKRWSNISLNKVASKYVKVENGTMMMDLENILESMLGHLEDFMQEPTPSTANKSSNVIKDAATSGSQKNMAGGPKLYVVLVIATIASAWMLLPSRMQKFKFTRFMLTWRAAEVGVEEAKAEYHGEDGCPKRRDGNESMSSGASVVGLIAN